MGVLEPAFKIGRLTALVIQDNGVFTDGMALL